MTTVFLFLAGWYLGHAVRETFFLDLTRTERFDAHRNILLVLILVQLIFHFTP